MKPPCTIVVGSLLPSLRVMVARSLIDDHGLKPIEAAKKMEVTPAAITQYIKGSRGRELVDGIFEHEDVKKALTGIVNELTIDKVDYPSVLERICDLCKTVRNEGMICEQCVNASPALKKTVCGLCRQ